MSGTPFRCQVRLTLSDLDRDVYATRVIATAQQPDEPDEHVLLRFLAWVLFYDDRLSDTLGWVDLHEPDLQADDLTGTLSLWVECGPPPIKRLIKALGRSKTARFVCLFCDETEAAALRKEILGQRPRHMEQVEIRVIPREFMDWLESVGNRSMTWSATISEGTLYLDSDGHSGECQPQRMVISPHSQAH